jgi:threonine dehydrogenase-like Zn-dependent dehydrogenase
MQLMRVDAYDTVLIAGLGPVGLGGVINARYRGARVIGVDGVAYRRKLAEELGAAATFDPAAPDLLRRITDLTQGLGVDKAIDCAGAPEALRLLVDATRRKGEVTFIAEAADFNLRIGPDMLRKGLTLRGCWHYNLGDAPRILKLIQAVPAQLDKLVTHSFPMSRVQEAWQLQITGNCGKVVLDPWS